jgi:hypothetical protein
MATFRKLHTGEWTVTGDEITRDTRQAVVTKADGTIKTVQLTGLWIRVDGVVCWKIRDDRPMRRMAQSRRPSNVGRYDGYALGSCAECEMNADTGDGRGCSRHRGNPRV